MLTRTGEVTNDQIDPQAQFYPAGFAAYITLAVMTTAYTFWTSVVVGGAIAGAFLKPRAIGILGGSLFALCVFDLIVSAFLSGETLTWVFGIGAMIVPPVAVVAFLAGAIFHALLRAAKPKKSEERSGKPNDS